MIVAGSFAVGVPAAHAHRTPGADLNDWARNDPNWTATIAASAPTSWISLAGQRRAVSRARGIDLA
jgi:hypothetical protein